MTAVMRERERKRGRNNCINCNFGFSLISCVNHTTRVPVKQNIPQQHHNDDDVVVHHYLLHYHQGTLMCCAVKTQAKKRLDHERAKKNLHNYCACQGNHPVVGSPTTQSLVRHSFSRSLLAIFPRPIPLPPNPSLSLYYFFGQLPVSSTFSCQLRIESPFCWP